MIIQIYDVHSVEEANNLADLGINNLGTPVKSKTSPPGLTIKETKNLFANMPSNVKSVGLTLASDINEISEMVEQVRPNIVQLAAANESNSPEDVKILKEKFPDVEIMRVIYINGEGDIELAKSYDGVADLLLLDTAKETLGSTGVTHDWNISKRLIEEVGIPVILAGGLGPDNVAEAIKTTNPAGVDSKTKTDEPGGDAKDLKKVKAFVEAVKSVDSVG